MTKFMADCPHCDEPFYDEDDWFEHVSCCEEQDDTSEVAVYCERDDDEQEQPE